MNKTMLNFWVEAYHPNNIIEFDINKCLFFKDNHFHFVMIELSGIEAIHLIDEEIKQVINLNYDALSEMFNKYLEEDLKKHYNSNTI